MEVSDIKGKVDFAIITIREDEFEAVLARFPRKETVKGKRFYNISYVEYSESEDYLVVVTRSPEQGTNEAQNLARDIIEDLNPHWLLLVGIAGGVPEYEFTLGDVVIVTRLNDFSVSAAIESKKNEFSSTGGPMHTEIQRLLANLPAWKQELQGWSDEESIGMPYPTVELQEENFYGSESWQKKVKERLEKRFCSHSKVRPPLVITGAVASSDTLVKDTELVEQWKQSARHLLAVEMELAGVYVAARQIEREYPILAIRGISDIVGFRRDPGWTTYACNSAAAFVSAFIRRIKPFEPRKKNHRQKSTPQTPWESMVKILDSDGNTVGSGFMIRSDGYFITCHQVIYHLNSINVEYREKNYQSTWCKDFSDPEVDIAILKIDVEDAKPIPIAIPKDQMVSALVYGFPHDQVTKFSKSFDAYGTLDKSYTVNTISTYDKTIDVKFANSWNKKPQDKSTFFAYRINGGIDRGIRGGAVLDEESGCIIGVIQSCQNNESYVISWENITDRLKLLKIDPNQHELFSALTPRSSSTSTIETSSDIYLPNPGYRTLLGRETEIEIIKEVLRDTPRRRIIGVDGFGGIGKTALVQEIIKSHLDIGFDKVVWQTASTTDNSEQMTFETVLDGIARQLNRPDILKLKSEERKNKTRELLYEQPVLIVLDNMETSAESQDDIIEKLLPILGSSKALLTSRHRFTETFEDNLFPIRLRGLNKEAARDLMKDTANQKNMVEDFNRAENKLDQMIQVTGDEFFGYTPMALKFILGQLQKFDPDIIIDGLEGVRLTDENGEISDKDEFKQFWKHIFFTSLKLLDSIDKKFMSGMTLFEPNVGSNTKRIMSTIGLNNEEFRQVINKTWKVSFLEIGQRGSSKTYYQHRLSYTFFLVIISLLSIKKSK